MIDRANEFVRMTLSAILKCIGMKIKIKKKVIQRLYMIHLTSIQLHILYYFLVRGQVTSEVIDAKIQRKSSGFFYICFKRSIRSEIGGCV